MITGKQIKNNSLTGVDIRKGSVGEDRLSGKVRSKLNTVGTPGATGATGETGPRARRARAVRTALPVRQAPPAWAV